MRQLTSGVAVLILAFGVFAYVAGPARAASGYDSTYFGESAFLSLTPGQSGQFAAGFNNSGSTGWLNGTASQVDLQVCGSDKVTCGIPSANAAWASGWLSSTAYATTSTDYVGPGQTGFFVYNIVAPSNSAGQTVRFNGDLALHASGQQLHPQGYYQDATVNIASFTIAPTSASPEAGTTVQFTVNGAAAGSTVAFTVTGACGTINPTSGLFTAETVTSPCSVVATTSAGQSASATVTVVSGGGGGGGGTPPVVRVATELFCGEWDPNPIPAGDSESSSTIVSILDQNGDPFASGSFSIDFTHQAGLSTVLFTDSPQLTSGGHATFEVRSTGTAGTDTYLASSDELETSDTCPVIVVIAYD